MTAADETLGGLPVKHELQLTDDFAFLASTSTLPNGVAAAALQQNKDLPRLRLTVAANQGIRPDIRTAFRELLDHLERRAQGLEPRDRTHDRCQRTILTLHRDRIFGRLGSSKGPVSSLSKIRVHERVADLLKRVKARPPQQKRLKSALVRQLQNLKSAIEAAENESAGSEKERTALGRLVRVAFEVTKDNANLPHQLRQIGIDTVSKANREVRELRALANYWRIVNDFPKVAGKYRQLFRSIDLNVLEPGPPESISGKKRFVHAEIQILVHFELHPSNRPRFIGASKLPCFLCHSFIRAHGAYGVAKSHGEVYEQWTVPGNPRLSQGALQRLRPALSSTVGAVQRVLALSKKKKGQPRTLYNHPLQTVSKLLVDQMTSASASIESLACLEQPDLPGRRAVLETATDEAAMPALARSASSPPASDAGRCPTPHPSPTASTKSTTSAYDVSECHIGYLRIDDIELFVETEEQADLDEDQRFCRARPVPGHLPRSVAKIDVEEVDGDGTTIAKAIDAAALCFVLTYAGREVLIEFSSF